MVSMTTVLMFMVPLFMAVALIVYVGVYGAIWNSFVFRRMMLRTIRRSGGEAKPDRTGGSVVIDGTRIEVTFVDNTLRAMGQEFPVRSVELRASFQDGDGPVFLARHRKPDDERTRFGDVAAFDDACVVETDDLPRTRRAWSPQAQDAWSRLVNASDGWRNFWLLRAPAECESDGRTITLRRESPYHRPASYRLAFQMLADLAREGRDSAS